MLSCFSCLRDLAKNRAFSWQRQKHSAKKVCIGESKKKSLFRTPVSKMLSISLSNVATPPTPLTVVTTLYDTLSEVWHKPWTTHTGVRAGAEKRGWNLRVSLIPLRVLVLKYAKAVLVTLCDFLYTFSKNLPGWLAHAHHYA